MLARFLPEGWWQDLCGHRRVLHHSPLQPAMHQHLWLLQVPVCGWLRSPGAQPQYVQGSVRSAWCSHSLPDPGFHNTFSLVTKMFVISAEEPFLIMADHHEIRKLSVDGSNYTILKQVCVKSHHIMPVVSFWNHTRWYSVNLSSNPPYSFLFFFNFLHFLPFYLLYYLWYYGSITP